MPKEICPTNPAKRPKIGFYLENISIPNADLRFPEVGNPGIGGSEFGLAALPYFFSLNCDDFDLVIYANVTKYLPNRLAARMADNSVTAARNAIEDNCQMLLVRLCDSVLNREFIRAISASDIKVIVWAQNHPTSHQMEIVAGSANISRLVCVGHEELDLLRDHRAFCKTTCIFNGIYPPTYALKCPIVKSGTTVVYLGSLIRAKGFHILAKAWPHVKKRVPGARLKVIGSGQVYNESVELGRWGVAEDDYEREFRPFLSDKDGMPEESVEFLGRLGAEKISIMQQADVGVVNPSGETETFCWSAVEFEACGIPVISAAQDGLLDTVLHQQTGLLIQNEQSLSECIVRLLEDRKLQEQYGYNAKKFVKATFDYKKICYEWQNLFFDVLYDRPNKIYPMKNNFFYHYKFLRESLRLVKYHIPRLQKIPALFEKRDIGGKKFLLRTLSAITGMTMNRKGNGHFKSQK